MKRKSTTVIPILVLLVSFYATISSAQNVKIAVSSNFIQTLSLIADNYNKINGHKIILIPGSTGKHYAQIINGAPYHAFFAADTYRPAKLEQQGYTQQGIRFTYAIGKLVLWAPDQPFIESDLAELVHHNEHHIAIANPELAPYGRAARQVLESFGVWESLQGRLVRGENIAQTFQFVESGNAPYGFVAWSQLKALQLTREGSYWLIPQNLYDPIEQQAVLLKNSPQARAFLAYCQSEEALEIIQANGYRTPDVVN